MDDATLARRQLAGQMAIYAAELSEGLLHPAPGVMATVCPRLPERSLPNAVLYEDPHAVTDAVLDELAADYDTAGIRAWTVWVRPGDDALAARLSERGHVLDGQPMLMAAELTEIDPVSRVELDLDPAPDWATIGRLNDGAYGYDGDFERLLAGNADDDAELWIALDEREEPAGCVVVRRHDGNAVVYWVAVLPEARGRGLSGELLRRALASAELLGCTTTSLESSALGEPVYLGLGYRALGRLGMWERRV